MMRKVVAVLLWMAAGSLLVHGQLPSGTINGRVTDAQGASVARAHVTVKSLAQGTVRETETNAEGLYVFPNLAIGTYDMRVEGPSFAPAETRGVVLQAGKAQTIDVALEPAGAQTTVNVTTAIPPVDLSQSMIQGQITSTTIENIPLNGRNFLELAYLQEIAGTKEER